jgi:proteasome lid subunit RPN8/RPN11
MLEAVVVERPVADELLEATIASWPWEYCGLLYGTRRASTLHVDRQRCVVNASTDQSGFRILRSELERVLAIDPEPCALYHTHPRRLKLSATDGAELRRGTLPWLLGTARWTAEAWHLQLAMFTCNQGRVTRLAPTISVE